MFFFKHKYIYAGEDEVHECTAAATIYSFAVCSFYTIVHPLKYLYLLTIHILYTYLYMYIYITAYVYIYMMGFCSVVFSELLFFNAGDFCTKNLSLGAFIFILFFFLRWEQTEPSLFKPIVEWSGGRTEKKRSEVRRGIPKQVTRLHSTVSHMHPSV